MTMVNPSPAVLRWAARRARLTDTELTKRFPKWPLWLNGTAQPTLKQLEAFSRLTHIAFGYFFLPQPPELNLPIPDFRTLKDRTLVEPSSNLLDTVYLCQQRQDWYREYAQMHGFPILSFVESASLEISPITVAKQIRDTLGLSINSRRKLFTRADALRQLITMIENIGVLVMISSVVGGNNNRKLDVDEFRGFVLVDNLAPLIFINGADSKAAQMFTLAHELAHVWLGTSGVTDIQALEVSQQQTEGWCNQVAAELLLPIDELTKTFQSNLKIADEIKRVSQEFKVSTLVVIRRLFDAGYINQDELWQYYNEELNRLSLIEKRVKSGGDFYNSLGSRTSKRFACAIVESALEGITSFSEAYRMLGIRKASTFYEVAHQLGVI
jgi:Zn-dependent peptidase ImmA (M78 family)